MQPECIQTILPEDGPAGLKPVGEFYEQKLQKL
jgi:hypothetical protein